MPAVELTPTDLEPFAVIDPIKAQAMIDDAIARAAMVAPCIMEDTFESAAAAKAIIRGAVLRWNDAGSGALQQETVGPFSQSIDTRQTRRGMFLPSEIDELKSLCGTPTTGKAFAVDTVSTTSVHADVCSLVWGALYCSCGADLSLAWPLWEV